MRRRVTRQELENITIDDVPQLWRKKTSIIQARKHVQMMTIRKKLESTYFLFAWNNAGMTVPAIVDARAFFPPHVVVRSLKNKIVRKAMSGSGWETFGTHLKGENMYVFVEKEEDLKPCIEAYIKMETKMRRKTNLGKLYEKHPELYEFYELRPLVGGCFAEDYKPIFPDEFVKLKDAPTKIELIAMVAGGVQKVTQKIASGIKQVPQKIAIGTKKITEKMEEDGKEKVGDVAV